MKIKIISLILFHVCVHITTQVFTHPHTYMQASRNTNTHTSIYIKLSLSQVVNGVEGLQIHRVSKKILNK